MGHLVEACHHGSLRDVVFATFEQTIAIAQTTLADILIGRHTGEGLHFSIERAVAHRHTVGDKGHIEILLHDVVFDDLVQSFEELLVEGTQCRGFGRCSLLRSGSR